MGDAPSDTPTSADGAGAARLARAKEIFLAVHELGVAERDAAVDRMCGADTGLRDEVRALLRGEASPLPFETLADDIKAAHRTRIGHADTLDTSSLGGNTAGPTGDRIGNYRLLERIGEGGFGNVYMAEQEKPVRRRVALKIIKLGMDTRQVVARFEAERQALAMMDHPNIAKVFDAGATATGRPYFVMELVRGLPITEYCDQRKLSIRDRLALIARVCEALQHAHSKGVIHRDIKPSNVLVSTVGDTPAPKIIDFGIAKATSARLTEKTIFTEFRQMIGTPEYMSPEQAGESGEDVDTRTDVYSLGVLLYELLAGATPFDSKRLRSAAFGELQRIIREEDPPAPSTKVTANAASLAGVAEKRATAPARLPGQIRGELDWIVMKALEKDRSRRYTTAEAFGADLHRYLEGRAVDAAPPGAAYRVRKFVRRNKGPVIAGALIALALVAGLIGTTVGLVRAEARRKEAVAERIRADASAAEARSAEATANRSAYSANMLSACTAMGDNQLAIARGFLDGAPAALRGWEWTTLASRLDTSIRSVDAPVANANPSEQPWENDLIAHPDGRSFFTVRAKDADAAHRWDLATGALLSRYPRPLEERSDDWTPARLVLSSDGSRLAAYCGLQANTPVCPVSGWDLRTGERVLHKDVPPIEGSDGVIGISADAARLLRNRGSAIWVQDVATGAMLASGNRRDAGDWGLFSPDGAIVACVGGRGLVELFDSVTLTPIALLDGHRNYVSRMSFSVDGRWLGTASLDGTVRVWDVRSLPSPGPSPPSITASIVLEHPMPPSAVEFSPDASLVATLADAIRVWDARSGALVGEVAGTDLLAGALMFMPDGRTVAARERDGTVRFWDIEADRTITLRGHTGLIRRVRCADACGLIVSGGWDGWKGDPGCLRLWDAATGDHVAAFGRPAEIPYTMEVSPSGDRVAALITVVDVPGAARDEIGKVHLEIVHLRTGRITRVDFGPPPADTGESRCGLAFDPTGAFLAVGRVGRIDILDSATGSVVRTRGSLPMLVDGFGPVVWSPDGRFVAFLAENQIHVVDAATLATMWVLETGRANALTFTPDSREICVGSKLGAVQMWSVGSGGLVRTFDAHDFPIESVAFNHDGSRLATAGGDDGNITVWDTATLDRVACFHQPEFACGAVWGAGGTRLVGACNRTIRLWEPTPLRERVAARAERTAALGVVEPLVAQWFTELTDPETVIERIETDTALTPAQRKAALQVVLRTGLERAAR